MNRPSVTSEVPSALRSTTPTPAGPGEQVARSSFVLDPMRGRHSTATLAELGALIGARLTPLGEEGDGTGLIAVDEHGRVFLLDHTADWYLGGTVEEAVERFRSHHPDVTLMDLQMPEMSGIDAEHL